MLIPDKEYEFKYEIKKSVFISYLVPYKNFNGKHELLKKNHKKSNHIVWAYRYINEYEQVVENFTDDGEPKNTSGKPTLNVLKGKDLINSVIFTVRYFGGIKLGTGGLVKAYTESANGVINIANFKTYKKNMKKEITMPYSEINNFEYKMKIIGADIVNKAFNYNEVVYTICGEKEIINRLSNELPHFYKLKNIG